ncbi:ATP-binding protein [Pseudarthrobacter sp. NPDC092439]|uniref:GAF domain-containing sensor histidine kinase n=1 Tax=unclassified Pseudarthrobacter TaxID=2647000 RepID=UPI003812AD59
MDGTAKQMLTEGNETRNLGLREYGLAVGADSRVPVALDGSARRSLDNLVRLAARVCGVPYAVVNVITADQQLQIAAFGLDAGVCARDDSMCARVFLRGEATIVADASVDPRFASSPFVIGELGNVRFYASVPLETSSGLVLGSLCVFSEKAEMPDEEQLSLLKFLGHQVVEILELQHRTLQLNDALDELERSNAMLAEFASRVSHDLRTPLTTILGYVEFAEDDPDSASDHPSAEYLRLIGRGGRRMLEVLDDVLDYARAGGTLKQQPVSLLAVTAEAAQDLGRDLGPVTGIFCEDAVFVADRGQVRTLLQNLLANSINYQSPWRPLHVEVTATAGPQGITLSVADNGKGIPAADREKALEPLGRLNQPGDGPGTGLGLATCSRIAQAHGGQLVISDTPGGGTTVSMTFPALDT